MTFLIENVGPSKQFYCIFQYGDKKMCSPLVFLGLKSQLIQNDHIYIFHYMNGGIWRQVHVQSILGLRYLHSYQF